jgi:hypothetical protein
MRKKLKSDSLLGQVLFLMILGLLVLSKDYSKSNKVNQKYKHMKLMDRPHEFDSNTKQ